MVHLKYVVVYFSAETRPLLSILPGFLLFGVFALCLCLHKHLGSPSRTESMATYCSISFL